VTRLVLCQNKKTCNVIYSPGINLVFRPPGDEEKGPCDRGCKATSQCHLLTNTSSNLFLLMHCYTRFLMIFEPFMAKINGKKRRFDRTSVTSSFLFLHIYSLIFYRNYSKLDNDRSAVETSFFTVDFYHKVF